TAERVDAQMRVYMHEHAIGKAWPTVERLLVCISPGPESARLVRAAKRMADRLGAPWVAAYVETPAQLRLPAEVRDRVTQTLALATGAAWLTLPFFELANLVMVYLLGIVVVATRYGQGPSLVASILSVAALDFFFVPPVFTFAVSDVRYLFTFVVMLVVGLVTS